MVEVDVFEALAGLVLPANEVQIEGLSYQLVIRWLGRQAAGINGARLVKP